MTERRPARRDHASSSSPGSARARSARCCSPTWAPTSCGSTVPGPASADYTPNPVLERGRRSVAVDLKPPRGRDVVLDLVATADVLVESFRPGVAERLGLGPGRVPRPQPAPGLRPDDRLGAGRAAGRGGRPRHQLHRADRRPARHRARRRAAGPAAEPGRRLRRRGVFAGLRRRSARCWRRERPGRAGRRRSVFDGTARSWGSSTGCARGAGGRTGAARTCWTPAAPTTTSTRAPTAAGSPSARSRSVLPHLLDVLGLGEDPALAGSHKDRSRWPALRAGADRGLRDPHPGRVGRRVRRGGRLRHAGARPRRGRGPPARRRPVVATCRWTTARIRSPPSRRGSAGARRRCPSPAVRPGAHTREILAELRLRRRDRGRPALRRRRRRT